MMIRTPRNIGLHLCSLSPKQVLPEIHQLMSGGTGNGGGPTPHHHHHQAGGGGGKKDEE